MIFFFWAILNIVIAFYFLYLCYKGIRLVKREMGLGAAIILFIGLMSLSSRSNELNRLPSKQSAQWHFNADTLFTSHQGQNIALDKNMMFDIILYISYGKDKESNQLLPISASCGFNGVTCGIEWEPQTININPDSTGTKFDYEVYGNFKWKLLNGTIYTGYKNYKGTVDIK